MSAGGGGSSLSWSKLISEYLFQLRSFLKFPEFHTNLQKQDCDSGSLCSVLSGTRVRLWSEDGVEAEVLGLDDNGFLKVHNKDQGAVSLEPDGNSFDMLKNLVVIKQR